MRRLTETEMTELFAKAKSMRAGKKLIGKRKAYTVIVDEAHWEFATTKTLRKFLDDCYFTNNWKMFVNFDQGITINLDA